MNAHDAMHWKNGREKVAAGRPLTDAERDVLRSYGGDAMLRREVEKPAFQGRATKQRAEMQTTNFGTGHLRFCDLPRGTVRRTP
jgi:hypothetical protein